MSNYFSYFQIKFLIAFLFFLLSLSQKDKVHAAEAGVSFYVPGLYGDVAIAIPPPPGIYLLSTTVYYESQAANSLLPNAIDENIEAKISSQLLRGFWVSDETLFGAKMMMGFRLNALDVDVTADLKTPFGDATIQDDNRDFGDIAIMPLSLFWKVGNIHLNLYEVINIPTGKFNPNRFANTALNHWAFDTVLSATWIDPKTGFEISVAPGLIVNSENRDTDYTSGIEFHMDAMVNLHVTKELTLGIHGSVYHQLTEDRGGDPSLGSFKGRSYSLGPSITWYEQSENSTLYLSLKWLHEFDAVNRNEGDLTYLSIGTKF